MYRLIIANKNYSSWSLRPWILLKALDIPFEEKLFPFGESFQTRAFKEVSPSGKVPILHDGNIHVWDSLAIIEYIAEQHANVWPADKEARAWARSATAEMHVGFQALRTHCPMHCGIRLTLHTTPTALQKDLNRLQALWMSGLQQFGGPFLAGKHFTAVDAFYAPVVFRLQSYALPLTKEAHAYMQTMLAHPCMQQWYQEALAEPYEDKAHDDELQEIGTITADFRIRPIQS